MRAGKTDQHCHIFGRCGGFSVRMCARERHRFDVGQEVHGHVSPFAYAREKGGRAYAQKDSILYICSQMIVFGQFFLKNALKNSVPPRSLTPRHLFSEIGMTPGAYTGHTSVQNSKKRRRPPVAAGAAPYGLSKFQRGKLRSPPPFNASARASAASAARVASSLSASIRTNGSVPEGRTTIRQSG